MLLTLLSTMRHQVFPGQPPPSKPSRQGREGFLTPDLCESIDSKVF
jgi:hypothetical protein